MHIHILELGERGIGHGVEGFAGGVRDQVNVKFVIHRSIRNWAAAWG